MPTRDSRGRTGRKMKRVQQRMGQARRKIEEAELTVERGLGRAEREVERAERQVEQALGAIWTRPEPGSRGARFTRDQIAEAALAIADAEGFHAVSMRRVAAAVGAGTMTLYHYVRTKDELVALMDDAIMGELLVPDGELPADWRDALTLIARRTRASFARHPWILEAMVEAQVGPNAIRHVEQSVAAVAALDLDDPTRVELTSLVDDYVFGYSMRRPRLGEDGRFERGLELLLDGIALRLERG